jgi:Family of unknown function (DUF6221)
MTEIDVVEFLRAQLYAEEQTARSARSDAGGVWPAHALTLSLDDDADTDGVFETYAVSRHVALHDPERTIAAVQAARWVLDTYIQARQVVPDSQDLPGDYYDGVRDGLEVAVMHLANRYADHPDFNSEWLSSARIGRHV